MKNDALEPFEKSLKESMIQKKCLIRLIKMLKGIWSSRYKIK